MLLSKTYLKHDPSLALYLPFDEIEGSTVHDQSGNGRDGTWHGTLDGSQWGSEVMGKTKANVGVFNDTDRYVDVPNFSNVVVGLTAFSMVGWVYTNDIVTNGYDGFFGMRNGDTDDSFYALLLAASDDIEFRYRNSLGTDRTHQVNDVMPSQQMLHLGLVYDGTNVIAYVGGVQKASDTASGSFAATGRSFVVGIEGQSSGNYVNGKVRDVAFFTRVVTPDEMKLLASPFGVSPGRIYTRQGFQ